jgi:hypothetical protein
VKVACDMSGKSGHENLDHNLLGSAPAIAPCGIRLGCPAVSHRRVRGNVPRLHSVVNKVKAISYFSKQCRLCLVLCNSMGPLARGPVAAAG